MALDDYENAVNFVLAFAMVHDLPSEKVFFAEAARAMKPGARLLLVEPAGHVGGGAFERGLAGAAESGLATSTGSEVGAACRPC